MQIKDTISFWDKDNLFETEELDVMYEDYDIAASLERNNLSTVSIEDGFDITRNKFGYINLEYWAQITGYSIEQIIELCNGNLIWRDPKQIVLGADMTVGWHTKYEILTGNRIKKLKEAREIHKKYGQAGEVIKLLEDNLPDEVIGEEIYVNLGSPFLASIDGFIGEFIAKLLNMPVPPTVIHDSDTGKWKITINKKGDSVLNNITYGTPFMSAINIIKCRLNARPIKIYDNVYNRETGKDEKVLNIERTLAAEEKEKAIEARFQDYCHLDKYNERLIQEAYSDYFGYGICRFDGEYLELADISNGMKPYKHQKDAIAHILSGHNVLLAHNVGSGKTLEFSCGVHELIRLGFSKKAVIVVPNSTLDATAQAYKELFPMDNVMVCYPRTNFSPAERGRSLEKIKKEDKIVVFMPYSSFDMISLSKEYMHAKFNRRLRDCSVQIANAKTSYKLAKLYSQKKIIRKEFEKYKANFKDTKTACFDELGVDILVVDEFHNYKNITIDYCAYNSIVGMNSKGSKKADNMLDKVRFIQENNGHVIVATGTPITNSLADLYTLQYYLQPEELQKFNALHFGDWINTFCQKKNDFEVDVDSKNGRFITRFSQFHNLTELMTVFSQVCDFYQGDDIELGLPEFKGYTDVVVKMSNPLKSFIEELVKRTEAIRNHEVSRKFDNLLKITVEGRMAALDIRHFYEDAIAKYNKVNASVKNMAELYFKYPDKCQIAFCDISTPKDSFNIYDELKKKLIEMGVGKKHIAFVHDAKTEKQRMELERLFNRGEIRILIGSTLKLGTGSNVQEKLVAIHHIDVPWRPADMVQREGRILRQGNSCEEVFIYRYITEKSFDAYTYQLLENKQRFISQFLSGSLSVVHREESDCADTVLSYAEIKALAIGNPLIKKRVEVSNELEHARINQRQKRKELSNLKEMQMNLPFRFKKCKERIAFVKSDIKYYGERKESIKKDDRIAFGEELLYAVKNNIMMEKDRYYWEYQGFKIILPKHMKADKPYVILTRNDICKYSVDMDTDKNLGVCQRLDYCLENLNKEIKVQIDKLRVLLNQRKEIDKLISEGNEYDDIITKLEDKLIQIDNELEKGKVA
jgi:N12 class adenine-specific DNA methylase